MRWTVEDLEQATGGRATGPSGAMAEGVTIDSRRAGPGSVFVPVVAERDGHDFVAAAVSAGAAAYLYEPARLAERPDAAAAVAVADTSAALLDLGRAARRRLGGAMVVGVTGSVGKTSTKDLAVAAAGAGRRVVGSERSFNNELGVPLTLVNAAEETEVAVVEMGARGIGHIALLCSVARPTVAVVTVVAAVHTEVFGTIDDVAQGKGELVEALPTDGLAILNGQDRRVSDMAGRTEAAVLRYGVDGPGPVAGLDVVAEEVVVDDGLRARFVLRSPWGTVPVHLGVRGAHQVGNALAALAVAAHAGVDLAEAAGALEQAAISPWRMEVSTSVGGTVVINDAYNANPVSMAAALRALAQLPVPGRRVAVLGAMAELGPEGPAEHRRMSELASSLGVELVAVGTDAYGTSEVATAEDVGTTVAALGPLGPADAVLVKASRVAGLERLAAALLAG